MNPPITGSQEEFFVPLLNRKSENLGNQSQPRPVNREINCPRVTNRIKALACSEPFCGSFRLQDKRVHSVTCHLAQSPLANPCSTPAACWSRSVSPSASASNPSLVHSVEIHKAFIKHLLQASPGKPVRARQTAPLFVVPDSEVAIVTMTRAWRRQSMGPSEPRLEALPLAPGQVIGGRGETSKTESSWGSWRCV